MKLAQMIQSDIPTQILDEISEQTAKNITLFQTASLKTIYKVKRIMCPKRREK